MKRRNRAQRLLRLTAVYLLLLPFLLLGWLYSRLPDRPRTKKRTVSPYRLTEWEKGQLEIRNCFGTLFVPPPWRLPAYGTLERVW